MIEIALAQLSQVITRQGKSTDAAGTGTIFARLVQIAGYVDTVETNIGTNADAAGTTTLFARLAQIAAYVDTLETSVGAQADATSVNSLFGRLNRIGASGDAAGTTTVFAHLARIYAAVTAAGVDLSPITAETNLIGATTDAAGTNTIFARLAQIAGYTDGIEAFTNLIGTAADGSAVNTLFGKLAAIAAYVDQVEGYTDTVEASLATLTTNVGTNQTNINTVNTKIGANTDAAGTTTIFARLAQIAGYVDQVEGFTDTLETVIGLNTDVAGTATLFARLAQIAGYTDTLETEVAAVKAYVDTLETSVGATADTSAAATLFGRFADVLGRLGATGDAASGTGSIMARLAQIITYTDGVEAKTNLIGATGDAAGTTTIFARLAQIANYVDTVETNIGAAADATTAATVFGKLNKISAQVVKAPREIITNVQSTLGSYVYQPKTYFASNTQAIVDQTYVYKGKAYVIGMSGDGSLTCYDPATGTWTALTSMPTPRNSFAFVGVGSKMYVFGGYASAANQNACHVYDIDAGTWTALTNAPFLFRNGVTTTEYVSANNKIYLTGLYTTGVQTDGQRLICYDISSNTWTTLAACPETYTITSDTFAWTSDPAGQYIYRIGGDYSYSTNTSDKCYVYDIAANTWSSFSLNGYYGYGRGLRVNGAYYWACSRDSDDSTASGSYNYGTASEFLMRFDYASRSFYSISVPFHSGSGSLGLRNAWTSYRICTDGRNVFISSYDTVWTSNGGHIFRYDTIGGTADLIFVAGSTTAGHLNFVIGANLYFTVGTSFYMVPVSSPMVLASLRNGDTLFSNVDIWNSAGQLLVAAGQQAAVTADGFGYIYAPKGSTQVTAIIQ